MTNLSIARRAALIVALAVITPVFAQRTEPGLPIQAGRLLLTRLTTPVLTTDTTHAGKWVCSALNTTGAPLTVTVRAYNINTGQVGFDDHTCSLDSGKACTRFWETGIAGHYCTFTFHGKESDIRAGLQVSDEDGFSLFAEAH